jgi:hypothetical protein
MNSKTIPFIAHNCITLKLTVSSPQLQVKKKWKKKNQLTTILQKKWYTSWNKADFFEKDTLSLHSIKSGKQYSTCYKLQENHFQRSRIIKKCKEVGSVPLLGTWTERLSDEHGDIAFSWAISYWPCTFLEEFMTTLWGLSRSAAFWVFCAVCEDKLYFVQFRVLKMQGK